MYFQRFLKFVFLILVSNFLRKKKAEPIVCSATFPQCFRHFLRSYSFARLRLSRRVQSRKSLLRFGIRSLANQLFCFLIFTLLFTLQSLESPMQYGILPTDAVLPCPDRFQRRRQESADSYQLLTLHAPV